MELFGNYLGRKSGSRLSVEVRDGARYRKKKSPFGCRGFLVVGLGNGMFGDG